MLEDYQNDETTKFTVRIESELYERVSSKFHYGQLSRFIRNIFEFLDVVIEQDKFMDIVSFIYKRKSIMIKPVNTERKKA